MNSKNNLHNALKNAFEDHEVPLNESQWQRLEGAIAPVKSKRKFNLWYTFLLVTLTAITTYFLTVKYGSHGENLLTVTTNSNAKAIDKNTSIDSYFQNEKAEMDNPNKTTQQTKASPSNYNINHTNKPISKPDATKNVERNIIIETPIVDEDVVNSLKFQTLMTFSKPFSFNHTIEMPNVNMVPDVSEEFAIAYYRNREKENITKQPNESKLVLSAAAGYSQMNLKINSIENENKIHKDTRSIFEASNKNLNTVFFSLGFDYSILPGLNLGLNSGIQYLNISNPVNMVYQLTEVPFYNVDRTIIGYYSDSSNSVDLSVNSNNSTTFINIPLRLNYTFPINLKNEFIITAGANFSAIVSAKGKELAVNEGQVKNLSKKSYSKFNAGFLGGVQYSRQLKDPWWLGIEAQTLVNNMKFQTGPGIINAQLSGYRLNLILKYKL